MSWPQLVILDRDGVINADSANYIRAPREWQPLDGSLDAIARLHAAGILITVATNQSGLARGYFSRRTLYRIHEKMRKAVRAAGGDIATIAFCPHGPDDDCDCRKPRPGLLYRILDKHGVLASDALLIGDSERDLVAAHRAGVDAWLVRTGNGAKTESAWTGGPLKVVDNLAAAADELTTMRVAGG
ncbi:MAG: D-glycero-beta-D-manno-heptose 1,7-bisphosphate 7-phosphatase [Pseudomonadota bacterium]